MNEDSTASRAVRAELTDEQWTLLAPLLPAPLRRADGRGRPWRDAREVLSGVLWVLRNDAHWRALPEHFPPHQTCRRRFQQWLRDGTLRLVLEALADDLRARGRLDITECLVEDMLLVEECAGDERQKTSTAQARSSWQRRTALLLLAPATRRLLRRTGSPLARRLSLPTNGLRN